MSNVSYSIQYPLSSPNMSGKSSYDAHDRLVANLYSLEGFHFLDFSTIAQRQETQENLPTLHIV